MSENKKYYWMKLKEDFFNKPEIRMLESKPQGYEYVNILLKLYLHSLNTNGKLICNHLPMDVEMIAAVTGSKEGVVAAGLSLFKKYGLVEVYDSGAFYMKNLELFIGRSSTDGDRKKLSRLKAKNFNDINELDICPPEYRDKSIEYKEKIYKKESNSETFVAPQVFEIKEYFMQHSMDEEEAQLEAESFVEHHASNNWIPKKSKKQMKSWKRSASTWMLNRKRYGASKVNKIDPVTALMEMIDED